MMNIISSTTISLFLLFYVLCLGVSLFFILKNEKNSIAKVLWVLVALMFAILGSLIYFGNMALNKKAKPLEA
ncbi:PLDc N-terminal domain-containing protein [Mesonia sp. HuA40]|uniref:PLDc N-terminal domain-containing protein n=1 Tax=Mesonia sp. HuA40 TaxID=2602761 RepID=UPI0011C85723|nr:PLDc N-terminal domain-containing protein [Mesonia sp. HuA40]TXK72541.1 hypothetical protein FT993_06820 [Mesonia sp. HuA40]